MNRLLLVRYGEIALKGKNRPFFEKKLLQNIRYSLKGLEPFEVLFQRGRYFVKISTENLSSAQRRLQRVFGIVSISTVTQSNLDLDEICRNALETVKEIYNPGMTFKVNTRRANKKFPYTSPEVSSAVGAYLLKSNLNLKVDVHHPDTIIYIDIRGKKAYLYSRVIQGLGGLPVGVAGRGLLLLSGGIDSPVAGWLALKRGVEIETLHFHSPPFTGEGAVNKVRDLCRTLSSYGGKITLHLAPFTEIQKELRLNCPETMVITLMRRAMFRIAERLAIKKNIPVLFTGESLGQVASQTLENIVAINAVTNIPVLRPLIGFDKEEIINIARKINSYSISIRPFEDCCTLFVPRHPVTRPQLKELEKAEESIPLEELIDRCLENIESTIINSGHERSERGQADAEK
ncbi:MAG TPA: tRNA 4-thiouridine(8) synthase ThiI [Firmicutes bacterium]|nr:tRNA 4-thiouridine(8) synthase ThiI [Bacillota bacterium]